MEKFDEPILVARPYLPPIEDSKCGCNGRRGDEYGAGDSQETQGAIKRNVFLFVVWSRARKFERQILERIGADFKILSACRIAWPRSEFVHRLWDFYKFGSYFTWWNKARKCGRGPFLAVLVEDPSPEWIEETDTRGQKLLMDGRIYRAKRQMRELTGHSNIVHSSVTPKETEEQVLRIFGMTLEELLCPPSSSPSGIKGADGRTPEILRAVLRSAQHSGAARCA